MKIGLNLLLWTTHATREDRERLAALKRAGADGVEVPVGEGDPGEYRDFGALLNDLGLARTSSMAFTDPGVNPVSPDPARRRLAADELKRMVDRAAALGADVLCGPMYQTLGVFTGNGPTDDERKWASDVIREAADAAAPSGLVLALENLNRFEAYMANTVAIAADLARLVDRPNVGVHFDTFHANIEEKDPVGVIRRHADAIRHVHISANDRGVPGEDHIDWTGTFAALKDIGYDGWLVVESFGRALPGLAAATRIWRDLFPSPETAAEKALAFVRRQWQ